MNEYKLYARCPKWLFIACISAVVLNVIGTIDSIKNYPSEEFFSLITSNILLLIDLFLIIQIDFRNKYCYTISNEGISVNAVGFYKKNIKWDSDLYYLVTKSYFGLYSYQKMKRLTDKIVNENNIEDGYIVIKTKRALKRYTDNKELMAFSTKLLKNNVKIPDIVEMINKSLEEKTRG
jgi:hypothetical protein